MMILSLFQLYDMDKAKSDHADRMNKAAAIKAEIDRTLAGVEEANAVLQVKQKVSEIAESVCFLNIFMITCN